MVLAGSLGLFSFVFLGQNQPLLHLRHKGKSAVNYADVVVVKTGESLKIRFLEQIPDSAACVDYMLQGGGSYKGHVMFQQSLYEPFALNLENGVAAYPAERHPLYGLASSLQTLRGIRLICTFGFKTVEYRFFVRHAPNES